MCRAPATPPPGSAIVDRRAILGGMRADTLHRIVKAVLELFSTRDIHGVGHQEVARSADVSLQTIYKYFGSKEVLVYAMLDVMLVRLADRMIDHCRASTTHASACARPAGCSWTTWTGIRR
jgi:AcrR family transcriptional regulator